MATDDTDDAPKTEGPASPGPSSRPGDRSLFEDEDPTGDSRIRSAADDPTAVWDEDSLHQVGMGDVHGLEGGPQRGPATTPSRGVPRPSIELSADVATPPPRTAPASSPGLSWTATLLLAAGLGALVFTIFYTLR